MPVQLPTDTQHLSLETRQYELFNRPLGQGISRRKIGVGAIVCGVWWLSLALIGVSVLSRFGPTAYIVPPFAIVYFGVRTGDDGRMRLVLWYDAVLARLPSRRRVVRNPLLDLGDYTAGPIRMATVTELHPRPAGTSQLPALMGRGRRRSRPGPGDTAVPGVPRRAPITPPPLPTPTPSSRSAVPATRALPGVWS